MQHRSFAVHVCSDAWSSGIQPDTSTAPRRSPNGYRRCEALIAASLPLTQDACECERGLGFGPDPTCSDIQLRLSQKQRVDSLAATAAAVSASDHNGVTPRRQSGRLAYRVSGLAATLSPSSAITAVPQAHGLRTGGHIRLCNWIVYQAMNVTSTMSQSNQPPAERVCIVIATIDALNLRLN